VAESTAWRSMVAGECPSASAMIATGASLVSSCRVPSLAAGAEDVLQASAQVTGVDAAARGVAAEHPKDGAWTVQTEPDSVLFQM
jgi:hypothetical protein